MARASVKIRKNPSLERTVFFGLNLSDPRHSPDSNGFLEASDIQNVQLLKGGGFRTRLGRQKIATLAEQPHSLDWFRDYSNVSHLIIGAGTKVYDDVDGGGAPGVSLTGLTNDTKSHNAVYRNFLWHANGTDLNRKFDGTNWSSVGVPMPAVAPVVADAGVGVLSGTFQYVYHYVYKNAGLSYEAEGAASPLAEISGLTLRQINVTVIASAHPDVDNIRIFRRSTTVGLYRLVIELPNANATHLDNVTDANLGRELINADEGAPPVLDGFVHWKNRLWGWKGPTLYHSRPLEPEKFFTTESDWPPEVVDTDNNEDVVTAVVFKNMLVVFTASRMRVKVGDDDPFIWIDIEDSIGCAARRTAVDCSGILRWTARDGNYKWDAVGAVKHDSDWIDTDFEGNERGLLDSPPNFLSVSAAVYEPNDRQYWHSNPFSAALFNSRTFIYEFTMRNKSELSQWGLHTFSFADAVVTQDSRIFSISSTTGDYFRERFGTQDEGTTISAYYESRHWNFDYSTFDKRLHYVSANGRSQGEPIEFRTIFNFGEQTDSFLLTTVTDVWGADAPPPDDWWGTDPPLAPTDWWGGNESVFRFLSYPQWATGMFIGFRIEMIELAEFLGFSVEFSKIRRAQA